MVLTKAPPPRGGNKTGVRAPLAPEGARCSRGGGEETRLSEREEERGKQSHPRHVGRPHEPPAGVPRRPRKVGKPHPVAKHVRGDRGSKVARPQQQERRQPPEHSGVPELHRDDQGRARRGHLLVHHHLPSVVEVGRPKEERRRPHCRARAQAPQPQQRRHACPEHKLLGERRHHEVPGQHEVRFRGAGPVLPGVEGLGEKRPQEQSRSQHEGEGHRLRQAARPDAEELREGGGL
mmetsp:Transcript_622/g.2032  ORF Transcript_622/g.2032 Transcript_622/m.2032 type:complete len:235 (-) Transcript_622:145-849(-)